MRNSFSTLALTALACALVTPVFAAAHLPENDVKANDQKTAAKSGAWDKAAAAKYLDDREVWWQEWPHAQKDHGTVCVSCHTQVPYALARPLLRNELGEQKLSDPERAMLDSIIKRVNLGNDAETFYSDAEHGPGKTREARNAEAVNNALILASYDAAAGQLQPVTRKAFDAMWALQEQGGEHAGAWIWQNFHFSPWEAPESEYWGAAMAAVATGMAPDHYRSDLKIQPNLTLLRGYLRREAPNQPLINRVALLWASSKLLGLMTGKERAAMAAELAAKQHEDGGWSLAELGSTAQGKSAWKRHDATPFDLRSDGYATGMIVLALEDSAPTKDDPAEKNAAVQRGLAWLLANQSKADGRWQAWSVNVKRDPESGVGKFMSDAATAFSVMALDASR
jgi:squalene-hopene/tetraprenyl-beta-curcumene cyclase